MQPNTEIAALDARPSITIVVRGTPAPQGSKNFLGTRGGKGILVESSRHVKPWREAVRWAALEAMRVQRNGEPIAGPVEVVMVFTLPKPKSAPKHRRTWPDRKPDLSKLVRSTEDALTDVRVWDDDARVVSCGAIKTYPKEEVLALDQPGVFIKIRAVR